MNLITPLILIVISIGAFFAYIDPTYRGDNLSDGKQSIISLQTKHNSYKEALDYTTEIRSKREALITKKGDITDDQLSRLESLLPNNVDNIKLVININQIAREHSLTIKDIEFISDSDNNDLGQDNSKYGTIGLSFSIKSSYSNFQNFLADLEKSLRLVDITSLSVVGGDTGIYDFSVGLKTYWLK